MPSEEQSDAKEAHPRPCALGACPKHPSWKKKNLQNRTVINLTLFPCNVAKNKENRYRVNKHGYLSFHLVLVQYIMPIKKQNYAR